MDRQHDIDKGGQHSAVYKICVKVRRQQVSLAFPSSTEDKNRWLPELR